MCSPNAAPRLQWYFHSLEPSGMNSVSCQSPEFTPRPLTPGPASPITHPFGPHHPSGPLCLLFSADSALHPLLQQTQTRGPQLAPRPVCMSTWGGESRNSSGCRLCPASLHPCWATPPGSFPSPRQDWQGAMGHFLHPG